VKIPGRKDPKENIFGLVVGWLPDEKKGTWLLVLDNLDDDVLSLPQMAPESGGQSSGSDEQLRRWLSAYLPQSVRSQSRANHRGVTKLGRQI